MGVLIGLKAGGILQEKKNVLVLTQLQNLLLTFNCWCNPLTFAGLITNMFI